jgi:hypothetical protein
MLSCYHIRYQFFYASRELGNISTGGVRVSCRAVPRRATPALASRLDLMGVALIFRLGAMPYDMVERSMTGFGEEVVATFSTVPLLFGC